jgi:hypothetical protein
MQDHDRNPLAKPEPPGFVDIGKEGDDGQN